MQGNKLEMTPEETKAITQAHSHRQDNHVYRGTPSTAILSKFMGP